MGLFNFKRHRKEELKAELNERVDDICDTMLEHGLANAENRVRAHIYQISEGDFTETYMREAIPVVERSKLRMDSFHHELGSIRDECDNLIHKLEGIALKKTRMEKMFDHIMSSPYANQYILYQDPENGFLFLVNNRHNVENKMLNQAEFPAVVVFDPMNNQITEKYHYEDLRDEGDYPWDIAERIREFTLLGTNYNLNQTVDIDKMREMLSDTLADTAEYTRNLLDYRNSQISHLQDPTVSMWDRAKAYVAQNNDSNLHLIEKTSEVYYALNNSALTLNYCEEGITSAYYLTRYGKGYKVYDVRECMYDGNGFLSLNDKTYIDILKSNAVQELLALEGLAFEKEDKYRNMTFTHIGPKAYEMKDVMLKEPMNPAYCYNTYPKNMADALYERAYKMVCRMEALYKKESIGTTVSYNPFNNSINVEHNGDIMTLLYSPDFEQVPHLCFRSDADLLSPNHTIVRDGFVRNQEIFDSERFQLLYAPLSKNLAYSEKTEGEAKRRKFSLHFEH